MLRPHKRYHPECDYDYEPMSWREIVAFRNGKRVATYRTGTEAAKALGVHHSVIYKAMKRHYLVRGCYRIYRRSNITEYEHLLG